MALLKCKYHPSALRIKEFVGENISEFYFATTTIENIENEIKKLNFSKKKEPFKIFCKYMEWGYFKGDTKLYFMYYSCVVIILFM